MTEFEQNNERREQNAPEEERREHREGPPCGWRACHPGMRPPRPDVPPDMKGTAGLLHGCARILGHRLGILRGKMGVLEILAEAPTLSQRELQERLRVQPGSLSEMLAKMEEQGLIQRTKDEADRRAMQVSLTEAGRAALEQREPVSDADLFAVLTQEERDTLDALLKKLLDHWIQTYGRPPRPMHSPHGPHGPHHPQDGHPGPHGPHGPMHG